LQSPSPPDRCRPSPCDRLSRPRSTTATPPRPARSADDAPIPTRPAGYGPSGSRHQTVPVFTAAHSIEEEPGSAPAASPRLRRRPSPWPPRTWASPARGVPGSRARLPGRAAPGPDPPDSSRFSVERRYDTGSSRAPLDPARRTRTIWQYWHIPALSGLLPPSPAPPGSGCPQLLSSRCDDPTAKVSHPHSNQSASRRTKPALNAFANTFGDRWPNAEKY
jgi:hypothetical protein